MTPKQWQEYQRQADVADEIKEYLTENIDMKLTIKELNELIYSLGVAKKHGVLMDKDFNEKLTDKLVDMLIKKI